MSGVCKKCGGNRFYLKQKGPHIGKYCENCNTWFKWMSKSKGGYSASVAIIDTTNNTPKPTPLDVNDDLPW